MTHDNVTDIVDRLNADADRWMAGDVGRDNEEAGLLSDEAANAIATLRKQLEDARAEALEEAAKVVYKKCEPYNPVLGLKIEAAIRALKGKS